MLARALGPEVESSAGETPGASTVNQALDPTRQLDQLRHKHLRPTRSRPGRRANKFKHGMGLRPQDDILSTLTLTPPNSDGSVPSSALTGGHAVNLFDGITTEFLSRASRKHGLETTQIAMMPVPTLVEAAAMAHTLALLFHNAAIKHFASHEPHEGRSMPAHPGLLVEGPTPGTLRPIRPFALRFPLTLPLRTNAGPEALLFWTNGHVNTMSLRRADPGSRCRRSR